MLTLPLFFENIVKHETGFAIKQNAVHKVCIPAAGSVTETGVYPGFIAYFPTDTMRFRQDMHMEIRYLPVSGSAADSAELKET